MKAKARSLILPSLKPTPWHATLGLLFALGLVRLAAQTPDVAHRGETYDEYNTRRIAEEVRNHRNRNPDFSGSDPSENADWGAWERLIARKRGQTDEPVASTPPRGTALQQYEEQRIASERARVWDAYEAQEDAELEAFRALMAKANAGDAEALLEVGSRLSTRFYYPSRLKIFKILPEIAFSYYLRAASTEDWNAKVNLIGLLPSLMEPQKYPITDSPGSIAMFCRGGLNNRYSEKEFESLLRKRMARGEGFAALQLAGMMQAGYLNGYEPATRLPDAERRVEVRRLLEEVRSHCSYVGTFFIGAMILTFPDTDGEYVACLKSLLENPYNLPGDTEDGYYTSILRDEARYVLAIAQRTGRVPGATDREAVRLLRLAEGPLYRFQRFLAGQIAFNGQTRLSVLDAADDYEFVLKKSAKVTFEEDPLFQPKDLPYKIALLRAIGHYQGDGVSWDLSDEKLDLAAAEKELKEAIAAAPDRQAAEEPTVRLLFLQSRQGNLEAAQRLLARTDGGLGAIARGLVLATGVKGGIEPDLPRALDAFVEGANGKDVYLRKRDVFQVLRRLVIMLADHTELKERVYKVVPPYFEAARLTKEEGKVVNNDFSLAAVGKSRAPITALRARKPMTEERILKMNTEDRTKYTATLLERLAKEAPPTVRPKSEENLRRDIRSLGWLARAGHDPALQALREKAEKGETDATIEAFRSLMAHSPANAFLCEPLLERLQANRLDLLFEEKWLPESAFPAASMLNPRSSTFETLLPLLIAEAPAQLPPGETFFRESKEGPSWLRQLVGHAFRRNPEYGELLMEVTDWERTARQQGQRTDSDAHRALLKALDETSRAQEPLPGLLPSTVVAALRAVGEPADWYQASLQVIPYEDAEKANALELYREIRDFFFALNPADADPLIAAVRDSYLVTYCRNLGISSRDPEAWRRLEPELARASPKLAFEMANTLVMCSRANAPQATALLLKVQANQSAPRFAEAAKEALANWGELQEGVFKPGPLLRFLAGHAAAKPARGYFLDEESSREYQTPGVLLDTELIKHLRAWSAKGDRAASELLADELARREKDLAPET